MGPNEKVALEQRLEATALLAGGIAHDFKNLLTVALGYIEMASTEAAVPEKVVLYCEKASEAVQRSTRLMQQMLSFTRVSCPNKKPLDFGRILKNSVIIAIGESPVTADFTYDKDPLLCEADERQMAQVISILVTNAIQAMPAGGKLSVTAGNRAFAPGDHYALAGGEYCRVTFTDSGTGIAAEDLPHIFDPFFTTKSKCSGLGLPIAYAILKYHGGFIEALPGQGAGASFALYLPVAIAAA